jgi:hypothetical protein
MQFEVKKLNIAVNLEKLQSYYNKVEKDFQHLCWKTNSSTVDNGVGGHRVNDMYGWSIHSNALDLSKPNPPYNIGLQKSDTYHWTELDFGIIEDFKQAFPFGHGYSIAVHPPGTFINTHIDSDDWIKIHVPIYTGLYSYFFFKENEYHMQADSSMYLVNTTLEHGTNNRGNETRVHLLFKIPVDMSDHVFNMKGLIG